MFLYDGISIDRLAARVLAQAHRHVQLQQHASLQLCPYHKQVDNAISSTEASLEAYVSKFVRDQLGTARKELEGYSGRCAGGRRADPWLAVYVVLAFFAQISGERDDIHDDRLLSVCLKLTCLMQQQLMNH